MANVLLDGRNNASGVVQVDDSWAFGRVLSVVMIITNMNKVLHFFLEGRKIKPTTEHKPRERKASTG
jgi:hypothetical protein